MNLIKEFDSALLGNKQAAIKTADASDAGSSDIKKTDVQFSLLRNAIRSSDKVTGSDVNDYLERAHELNDQVDTVAFAVETSDGELIKIYVNAQQADDFRAKLADLLGLENDPEIAINELAQQFDIVDVVWPEDTEVSAETTADGASTEDSIVDNDVSDTDETIFDNDDIAQGAEEESPDAFGDEESDDEESDEETSDEDDYEDVLDDDGNPKKDKDGNVIKRKKKLGELASDAKKNVKESLLASIAGAPNMIGSKFLERVLEADESATSSLDTQYKAMYSMLKRPLEKKLILFYALTGIPGRFVNNVEGAIENISAAADFLRKNPSVKKAFDEFFTLLSKAVGSNETEQVQETSHQKRGDMLQKRFETILVLLGLPPELVETDGPSPAGPYLYRVSRIIDGDGQLEGSMNNLAMKLGIHSREAALPIEEDLSTAPTDAYVSSVIELVRALGIPEKNLNYQRQQLLTALRTAKNGLQNRGVVTTKMEALLKAINASKRVTESTLLEAYGDLNAMTKTELAKMDGVHEPMGGPAKRALHVSDDKHHESTLIVAVLDELEEPTNLVVFFDSPWDGRSIQRRFVNDERGYTAALRYAEHLRSAAAPGRGRPKGWQD